ncbi:hypothetical protein SVIOM342S_03063 [Streptomyces violaceorubidus]
MKRAVAWQPPHETAARRHSVFLDVELWSDDADGQRTWSCPFLAAVWQLARLGLLRNEGEAVLAPQPHTATGFPDKWTSCPPCSSSTNAPTPSPPTARAPSCPPASSPSSTPSA